MHSSITSVGSQSFDVLGHMDGRLAPLALFNAHRKLDAASLSVAVGGLSQEQIDDVEFLPPGLLARSLVALQALASRLR